MKHLTNKISNLITRGVITLANDDSKNISYCQVSYHGKPAITEKIFPYGMSANPPLNNITLLFKVGSNEANLAGIPYSQKYRFKGLKVGEVVFGNPITGSYIKFEENKDIKINSLGKIVINSTSDFIYDCSGNYSLNITGNLSIQSTHLGFFGSSPVARQIGGSLTAGGVYTANEQEMINKMFTALKNYGLLTS